MPEKKQSFEVIVNEYATTEELTPVVRVARFNRHGDYLRAVSEEMNEGTGVAVEVTRSTIHRFVSDHHRQRVVAHHRKQDTAALLLDTMDRLGRQLKGKSDTSAASLVLYARQLLEKVLGGKDGSR